MKFLVVCVLCIITFVELSITSSNSRGINFYSNNGENKLEIFCDRHYYAANMTGPLSTCEKKCKSRCLQFKGYFTNINELVCFKNVSDAQRISKRNYPCVCGYKPSHSGCTPPLEFSEILDDSLCNLECSKHSVIRSRKLDSITTEVIWCGNKINPDRIIQHLDSHVELVGGSVLMNAATCYCGVKSIEATMYHHPKTTAEKAIEKISDIQKFKSCSFGSFIVKKRYQCESICSTANAFLSAHGQKLVCYHAKWNAERIPSSKNIKNLEQIEDDNICECGASKRMKKEEVVNSRIKKIEHSFDHYSCDPPIKYENLENIGKHNFTSNCQRLCPEEHWVFIGYLFENEQRLAHCEYKTLFSQQDFLKLGFKIGRLDEENLRKCECVLDTSSLTSHNEFNIQPIVSLSEIEKSPHSAGFINPNESSSPPNHVENVNKPANFSRTLNFRRITTIPNAGSSNVIESSGISNLASSFHAISHDGNANLFTNHETNSGRNENLTASSNHTTNYDERDFIGRSSHTNNHDENANLFINHAINSGKDTLNLNSRSLQDSGGNTNFGGSPHALNLGENLNLLRSLSRVMNSGGKANSIEDSSNTLDSGGNWNSNAFSSHALNPGGNRHGLANLSHKIRCNKSIPLTSKTFIDNQFESSSHKTNSSWNANQVSPSICSGYSNQVGSSSHAINHLSENNVFGNVLENETFLDNLNIHYLGNDSAFPTYFSSTTAAAVFPINFNPTSPIGQHNAIVGSLGSSHTMNQDGNTFQVSPPTSSENSNQVENFFHTVNHCSDYEIFGDVPENTSFLDESNNYHCPNLDDVDSLPISDAVSSLDFITPSQICHHNVIVDESRSSSHHSIDHAENANLALPLNCNRNMSPIDACSHHSIDRDGNGNLSLPSTCNGNKNQVASSYHTIQRSEDDIIGEILNNPSFFDTSYSHHHNINEIDSLQILSSSDAVSPIDFNHLLPIFQPNNMLAGQSSQISLPITKTTSETASFTNKIDHRKYVGCEIFGDNPNDLSLLNPTVYPYSSSISIDMPVADYDIPSFNCLHKRNIDEVSSTDIFSLQDLSYWGIFPSPEIILDNGLAQKGSSSSDLSIKKRMKN